VVDSLKNKVTPWWRLVAFVAPYLSNVDVLPLGRNYGGKIARVLCLRFGCIVPFTLALYYLFYL
jgi:hypothetical protein